MVGRCWSNPVLLQSLRRKTHSCTAEPSSYAYIVSLSLPHTHIHTRIHTKGHVYIQIKHPHRRLPQRDLVLMCLFETTIIYHHHIRHIMEDITSSQKIYVYICVHIVSLSLPHTHIHTRIHTHTYTHTYTLTHTQKDICIQTKHPHRRLPQRDLVLMCLFETTIIYHHHIRHIMEDITSSQKIYCCI